MVVIAIVGLLATVVMWNINGVWSETQPKKVQADFVMLSNGVDVYRLQMKKYPQRLQDLVDGGIIKKIQKDPWGNDYVYAPPGNQSKTYMITSYGADGAPGGTGENQDLTTENIDAIVGGK
jgi:general secretion pathway protein G